MYDPSNYYQEKRDRAIELRKQICECDDPAELRRLKRLLEFAEYTGD
jgi:hypothetical protein